MTTGLCHPSALLLSKPPRGGTAPQPERHHHRQTASRGQMQSGLEGCWGAVLGWPALQPVWWAQAAFEQGGGWQTSSGPQRPAGSPTCPQRVTWTQHPPRHQQLLLSTGASRAKGGCWPLASVSCVALNTVFRLRVLFGMKQT